MNKSPIPGGPWTFDGLNARAPWVKWDEPVSVKLAGDETEHFACRICIANEGLKSIDVPDLPTDQATVAAHIEIEHIRNHHEREPTHGTPEDS